LVLNGWLYLVFHCSAHPAYQEEACGRLMMTNSKQRRKNKNAAIKRSPVPPASEGTKDQGVKPRRSLVKSLLRKVRSFAWDGLAFLGAFCTIWIAVWPHVYVYPSIDLDPNNPMFTPFVVRNEGYLAIRDVKFSCAVKYLTRPGGPTVLALGEYENSFSDPKQVSRVIAPGEEASELLPLSGMKDNQWQNADIAVRLRFRPWRWLPYEWKELHRFEVKRKGDCWHWLPQPINK